MNKRNIFLTLLRIEFANAAEDLGIALDTRLYLYFTCYQQLASKLIALKIHITQNYGLYCTPCYRRIYCLSIKLFVAFPFNSYWKLPLEATLRDVILVVRADEAHHRLVNHTLGSLDLDKDNPFKPGQ